MAKLIMTMPLKGLLTVVALLCFHLNAHAAETDSISRRCVSESGLSIYDIHLDLTLEMVKSDIDLWAKMFSTMSRSNAWKIEPFLGWRFSPVVDQAKRAPIHSASLMILSKTHSKKELCSDAQQINLAIIKTNYHCA